MKYAHVLKGSCAALLFGAAALVGSAPASADDAAKGAVVYNLQPVIFPYMAAQTAGVEKAAKEYGVKLVNANANGSLETQISQLKAAIAAGAKGVVIQTNDSIGIMPAIREAVDAGVCVAGAAVAIGPETGKVYPGTKGLAAWNENYAAELLGEAIAKAIGGEGDVAIEVGLLTNGTSKARHDSIQAYWKAHYPKIRVVAVEQHQFNVDKARQIALSLVNRLGDSLKAMYIETNPGAISVLQALKTTPENGKIVIGSIGGEKGYHDFIRQGLPVIDVPEVPLSEGAAALKMVVDCINGNKEPVFMAEQDLPGLTGLKSANYTVTKANVNDFKPEW
ncbi:MAG: sugar ABC transporter substrate-binding protein [Ancalomicrobiaceae bacterium]|nr:sugar ABC transporter substrate-binding protein [Ancalomicrobiaceae bacterium]